MAAGLLTPDPRLRELSDLGLILGGAKLNTYQAGTTTPLATYSDEAGTVPNQNPVVASAGGLFGPIYLTLGVSYKLVLTDALNNPIWSQDNVKVPATGNFVPASPSDATKFLNGAATPAFAQVKDSDLSTSDVTTNDVATTKHGFAPKLPNDATKFLNGVGAYAVPASVVTLLKANSGTDTAAGATNVDTVATGALTAKDSLLVVVTCSEATQAVARLDLYDQTDGQVIARLTAGGAMAAGVALLASVNLSPDPAAATTYLGLVNGFTTGGAVSELLRTTPLTAWTSGFTLALRHGGVTAGGTLSWKWTVLKVAGQ